MSFTPEQEKLARDIVAALGRLTDPVSTETLEAQIATLTAERGQLRSALVELGQIPGDGTALDRKEAWNSNSISVQASGPALFTGHFLNFRELEVGDTVVVEKSDGEKFHAVITDITDNHVTVTRKTEP